MYFFDTGIEMEATKKHISYLESKYNIKVNIVKPETPLVTAIKKVGYPFLSKRVSEYIERLQRHNFDWSDEDYETLVKKYPKCQSALKWWCNAWEGNSRFNINRDLYLKEFIIKNPPDFKISSKCCDLTKKKPSNKFRKSGNYDILFLGIRKSEGGIRSQLYNSCMSENKYGIQHFPIFWFKDEDKTDYENACNVIHSEAYTVYGCKRTGCAGCPFGSNFEEEIKMLEKYEPKLYQAVCNIFAPSYEYTRKYREFKNKKKNEKIK